MTMTIRTRAYRRAALVAPIFAIALVACESSPTELASETPLMQASADGARRFVDEQFEDLTDSLVLFACDEDGNVTDDGELIRLRGGLYSKFVIWTNPAGHIHTQYHTMPVGLGGTGETSGEDFRVKVSNNGNLALTANGASIPYQYTETLVGTSTGRSMRLVQSGMYRITDGRVIVDRERSFIECRV